MIFLRHRLSFLGALLFILAAPVLGAFPAKPTHFVTDDAGLINPDTKTKLETLLVELEQKTAAEVAVVTIKLLEGESIEPVANKLFNQWGIGKSGKNNGVLFLIAPADRQLRIEVGYGLEGILPDGLVGRIRDQYVMPYFQTGQMSEGIFAGTMALAQTIASSSGVTLTGAIGYSSPEPHPFSRSNRIGLLIFMLVIFFIVLRNPWLLLLLGSGRNSGGGWSGGGFGGGGFGGFGGGSSGGGGASGRW